MLPPSKQWLLQSAWSTYATGRAESSDAFISTVQQLRQDGALPRGMRRGEAVFDLIRCLRMAPPVAAVPLTIRTIAGEHREAMRSVRISIDGQIIGLTDDTGTIDVLSTPRLHLVTASETWGAPVIRLVDLSDGRAASIDLDLSVNHGGSDGGNYALFFDQPTAACKPFAIEYQFRYAAASPLRVEHAVVLTPEAAIPVDEFLRVSSDKWTVELTDCKALFGRLKAFSPPHVLFLQVRGREGHRYETRVDVRQGPHTLRVNAKPEAFVTLRQSGTDHLSSARAGEDGVALFTQLPGAEFVIAANDDRSYARERVVADGDRTINLRFVPHPANGCFRDSTSSENAPCEGQRDAHLLMFGFDAHERLVPTRYFRRSWVIEEVSGVSAASIERAAGLNAFAGFRKFVTAELLDSKGRIAWRGIGTVYTALEAPGGPWVNVGPERWWFQLIMPAGSAKTLRLRGWKPQMEQTFDLDELTRDASLWE